MQAPHILLNEVVAAALDAGAKVEEALLQIPCNNPGHNVRQLQLVVLCDEKVQGQERALKKAG